MCARARKAISYPSLVTLGRPVFGAMSVMVRMPDESLDDVIPITAHGGYSYEDGYAMTRDLLASRAFDGLFCYNDEMAILEIPDVIRQQLQLT